jgi:hypothetical protein
MYFINSGSVCLSCEINWTDPVDDVCWCVIIMVPPASYTGSSF